MTRSTTIINIFGAPGAGKSTAAAGIYCRLKSRGVACEYVPEFAKELSYANDMETLENQFYVSAIQYHRIFKLLNKVDFIITDSPVLTGIVYDAQHLAGFSTLLDDIQSRHKSINILLWRDESAEYDMSGRHHTLGESDKIHIVIQRMLVLHGVKYKQFNAREFDKLYEYINSTLEV